MPAVLPAAAQSAAMLPLFASSATPDTASGLVHAATMLAQGLGQGRALDSRALRSAMEAVLLQILPRSGGMMSGREG
jgi:hypothetical protein